MLALSSAIYMAGLATAQAVIALRGHALVALGWEGSEISVTLCDDATIQPLNATWRGRDVAPFDRLQLKRVERCT